MVMHCSDPPTLETFPHWPSWLNAYGNLDRSACFELRVSQVRRLAGCIPLMIGQCGQRYRDRNRRPSNVPDLPNERPARTVQGRISRGHYDITAQELDWLARQQFPRRLAGDWRTGRAPAMRPSRQHAPLALQPSCNAATDEPTESHNDKGTNAPSRRCSTAWGMTLEQGGHGPGERAYERKLVCRDRLEAFQEKAADSAGPHPTGEGVRQQRLPAPASMAPGLPIGDLDAGLDGNPNRGATREKLFGLDGGWTQRLELEKHHHASVSGKQYFLVCPGPAAGEACNRTAYKLFWVLARPAEHRDALLAEQWIASLDSGALTRRSAQVSALIDRYGPIMGDERKLRCRHCLDMRYGKSPEASRKTRERKRRRTRCDLKPTKRAAPHPLPYPS